MKVSELLDSPEKWTQQAGARDRHEAAASYDSVRAVKWCLSGALCKCYPIGAPRKRAIAKLKLSLPKRFEGQMVLANDHETTTFGMVRRWVLRAGI